MLNAAHETVPRELTRAIALIRILERKRLHGVRGVTQGVVYNAQYYAQKLFRGWVNLQQWGHPRSMNETPFDVAKKIWRKVHSYHADKLQIVEKYLANVEDYIAQLDVYATLPFPAPENIRTQININLHHARCAFSAYWHLDNVVDWSFEDMTTMLETGQYVDIATVDTGDSQ